MNYWPVATRKVRRLPFIHGYLETGDAFPEAVARWSLAYAGQVETDYAALLTAIETGRLPAAG